MMKSAPAWLMLRVPTLARPNEGIRSKRNPVASNTGMRTLTSSILTWDMIAEGLELDEEREVTPHPAIGEIGQRIADHGHDQYHGIGLDRWYFAEQWCAHDFQEIEQNIVIDDVSSAREHVMIVPENRRDEKRELQEVADDQLDVAKTRTHDRQ